jgi:hypothetical protein
MAKTAVKPAEMATKDWTCEYCGDANEVKAITSHSPLEGILACAQHEKLGNRDVKAALHQLGLVRTKDFCAAFTERSACAAMDSFLMKKDGVWIIPVNVDGSSVIVNKPITDPRQLLSLNMGFYLPEYFEYLQTVAD